jgi:hypothetical protein
MLYVLNQGNVEGFDGNQNEIVYLVTRTDKIDESGKLYVFTDGHAIMSLTEFYKDLADLDNIDWGIMEGSYWHDTDEFPDRKRKRQAEFLVHQHVEIDLLLGLGVKSIHMKNVVTEMLGKYKIDKKVLVKPSFYF